MMLLIGCDVSTPQRQSVSTSIDRTADNSTETGFDDCSSPRRRDGDSTEPRHAAETAAGVQQPCAEDPSPAAADNWYDGQLLAGSQLAPQGAGYVYSGDPDAEDSPSWGAATTISCLQAVGREFEATGLRLNVNDLSLRHGAHFPPHRSHQSGLDVDVRYVRRDGEDAPLDLRYHPEVYDPVATQDLMQLFVEHCPVEVIFADLERLQFSRSALGRDVHLLRQASGHSNHFHVRLRTAS